MSYDWIKKERAPQIMVNAVRLYGTREIVGPRHNPEILNWAKELNWDWLFKDDETPWCGLFVAIAAHRAGLTPPKNGFRAKEWANWGTHVDKDNAMFGDVLVFTRKCGGHVGLYVGEDSTAFHVYGGNQGNMACVTRILKSRCTAVRRTTWKVAQPSAVRKVYLNASGKISQNEA